MEFEVMDSNKDANLICYVQFIDTENNIVEDFSLQKKIIIIEKKNE